MKKRLFATVAALALAACGGGGDSLNDVTYSTSGTTTQSSNTWVYFDGSIGQYTLPVPYETSNLLFKNGDFLYLSAQNNLPSGTVTATIKVNGKVWKTVTSSGAYAIATVSGTCC